MPIKILTRKASILILALILIFHPLSNLLFNYFPISIFNINFYNFICFIGIYLIFIISFLNNNKYLNHSINYIVCFLAVISTNFIIHPNNIQYFTQYEVVLTLFILTIVSLKTVDINNSNLLSNIIIISCLVQAILSIFNSIFKMPGEMNFLNYLDVHRQTGFLLNANLYSSFLLIGSILNLYNKCNFFNIEKMNSFFKIMIGLTLFAGIYVSQSRFSMYFFILYFLVYLISIFYKKFNLKIFMIISSITTVLVIILIINFFIIFTDSRFSMGFEDDIRILKYFLGLKTILLNPLDLLFGMDRELFSQLRIQGTRLSDNSIFYIIMYLGMPLSCFMLIFLFYLLSTDCNINILSTLFYLGLIMNLFLTGAIFWHVYLLYFLVSFKIIFKKSSLNIIY